MDSDARAPRGLVRTIVRPRPPLRIFEPILRLMEAAQKCSGRSPTALKIAHQSLVPVRISVAARRLGQGRLRDLYSQVKILIFGPASLDGMWRKKGF